MTNLIPHVGIWAVLATIVIILALYRRKIGMKSDEMLHVLDSESHAATQTAVAQKLETIDLWGKILTVVVVLYMLAIVGIYIYSVIQDTSVKMT